VAVLVWYLSRAHVLFLLVARFERTLWKYRWHPKIYSALLMEAAHFSQTLYLVAAELGLGAFVTAIVNNGDVDERLGLATAHGATETMLGGPDVVERIVDHGERVYTLALRAGQPLHGQASAVPAREEVLLLPPGAAPFTGSPPSLTGTELCIAVINLGRCDATTPIATGGAYTLIVETDAPGVQYTLQASAQ